ncbi:hypothetical protein ANCDUO_00082 [Ancylostoma duodenale]|uniref:Uncharacterized protein n=1 Tax=Ancylostoma duodenale TaxID=51022 RepID=A0A0C2H6R1_9BILA|nr:hypothetical protein ANCDUO_00082 [Ancylostoma duodenale]
MWRLPTWPSHIQTRGDPRSRKCQYLRARSQLAAADGGARQGRRAGAGRAPRQHSGRSLLKLSIGWRTSVETKRRAADVDGSDCR